MQHVKKERSFVIVKPDGVQRSLIGEIIGRFERAGLKIAYLNMAMLDSDKLWKHYDKDNEWFERKGAGIKEDLKNAGKEYDESRADAEFGKDIIRALVQFMTAGPVIVMVLEGNQAVAVVKKLVGGTEPATSDVGTIRGDLTLDSYNIAAIDDRAVRNLIHCSDAPDEAEREIDLWLSEDKVLDYRLVQERILYDVNLDGILE
jgi:nucleoside-diphosphate kinase